MTAPGRRGLIAIGVVVFLVSATMSFPAHVAAGWFLPDTVQASGVQGTLWHGTASAVVIDSFVLGATDWRVRPLNLLLGRLRADFDIKLEGGALSGQASAGLGGKVRLRELYGVIPLSMLSGLIPTEQYDGRLGLDIESAVVNGGWLVDASGTVDIVGLRIINPIEEPLGDYEFTFSGADDDSLDGVFRDSNAPLKAEGVLILHADRRWELNGTITPTPQTPSRLSQGLAVFATTDAQGRYQLSFSGDL